MRTRVGVAAATVGILVVSACGGGAAGESSAVGAAGEAALAQMAPEQAPPEGVEIVAKNVPEAVTKFDTYYDYPAAVQSVVNLRAALVRARHTRGADQSALKWVASGSEAEERVREFFAEAAQAESVPVGSYVLRGFVVGGFTDELLQIDVCLDRRDVRLRSPEGEESDLEGAPASEVLWAGYAMEPDDDGTWRASSILLTEVGDDPTHKCNAG